MVLNPSGDPIYTARRAGLQSAGTACGGPAEWRL